MTSALFAAAPSSPAILVIMPRFLGDSVTATAALQMLQQLHPHSRIALLARPHVAAMFSDHHQWPGVDVILDQRFCKPARSLWQMARQLRREAFSEVYHCRNSFADALLAKMAGIRRQVGYKKNGRTPLLTDAYRLDPNYHYQYRYCHLVNEANGRPFGQMPAVRLLAARQMLTRPGLRPVAVYFGGQYKLDRHYPFALASAALQQIAAQQPCHFFLLGDAQEQEDNGRLALFLQQQQIAVTDLTGHTSISQLLDTIQSCELVLTIDSGQLHMAAAMQVPYVAVVGFGTSPWSCVEPKVSHGIHLYNNSLTLELATQICEIRPEQLAAAALQLLGPAQST